ncbi:hypothetical protein TRICI_006426 [Trichomonascus ciferrii]|uniref:B30.2/SPRY domain-containing protein n=1 Tax=Trichomonascus ciferrii TaxID=44093 RepID=A0A642UNX4_9ASCO|nr:hypothetical protein TRICI_006426 [Trichomonascus ciferrii]
MSRTYIFQQGPEIPEDELRSLNVPLLVGLLSAVGALLLALLCAAIWFAVVGSGRIRLGSDPAGVFDDEQRLLEEEEEALEHMDEQSRRMYYQAKAYIEANPPNSASSDISLSQFMTIQEKGVSAWEFDVDFPNANCFVEGRTEIEFFDSVCCTQTNLPLPKQNDVYYWEAKIYDKPLHTTIAIGLTTKPYPTFRLPGYHRFSVAYDSTGLRRINQPFSAPHYGPPLQQGDVVGVGYRTRTGTVFFTRNGKKLDDALHGMRLNLFPTIGATGPATVMVNFGQSGFVFIEANVKKWGLAPVHGSLAPPPPYGAENDFVLLETGHEQTASPPPPPSPPPHHEEDPSTSRSESVDDGTQPANSINLTRLNSNRRPSPPPSYTSHDSDEDEENEDSTTTNEDDHHRQEDDEHPM